MFLAPCGSGGGWLGCTPTHIYMHTHTYACVLNMIISCKWPPPLRESLGIPYDVICMCMCAYKCVGGTLSPHHTHIHPSPPPPPGVTPGISKNSIALELIKIFQFCLKIWNLWRPPHPWVGVWFSEWVGG